MQLQRQVVVEENWECFLRREHRGHGPGRRAAVRVHPVVPWVRRQVPGRRGGRERGRRVRRAGRGAPASAEEGGRLAQPRRAAREGVPG